MKKMKIRICISVLTVIVILGSIFPSTVLARDVNDVMRDNTYHIPPSQVEAEHQRQLDEFMRSLPQQRMEPEMRSVLVRQRVEARTFVAGGQPAGGTTFPNTNSGFNWADGGNNVSASFTVGWGAISVSLSTGRTGVMGNFIATNIANTPVRLHVTRHVEIREWHIETRPFGSAPNAPWRLHSRFATATTVRLSFDVRRV